MKNYCRIVILCMVLSLPVQDLWADEQVQSWSSVTISSDLSDSKTLRAKLELQHRTLDELRNTSRLIYRPSLEYEIAPKLWLSAGYLYMPTYRDGVVSGKSLEEHRPWQQILYQSSILSNPAEYYLRLEERFIEGKDQPQYRARILARASKRLGKTSDYGVTGFNEFFLSLDKNDVGPDDGFDQNRAFIGLYAVHQSMRLEVGYLHLTAKHYLEDPEQSHIIRTALSVKW